MKPRPLSNPPDSAQIRTMFDRLSGRYDLFNRLTSLGQDMRWRRESLKPLKPGMRVLDLGCGTGDLSFLAADMFPQNPARIVAIDFSSRMLSVAEERQNGLSIPGERLQFLQRRAEDLPMERECYDLIVSGFVLRNIYENIDYILKGVYASLKSGGQISFLDFTEPPGPIRRTLWKIYMSSAALIFGRLLFGKDFPAHYMADSAKRFIKPPEMIQKLYAGGFKDVRARFFMMKSIVLYQAAKG